MVKDSTVDPGGEAPLGATTSLPASLLGRLKGGDADAWNGLARLYAPEVYRWCRRAGLRAEDAEDVGQEVFRAVAANLADFRRERPGDSFRGWLWTIARNKMRDHWRRGTTETEAVGGTDFQERVEQIAAESDGSDSEPGGTSGGLVRRALEYVRPEFEERTWRAFWRVAVDGAVPADVARELGTTPNAVYVAKSRVLGRLREELGDILL